MRLVRTLAFAGACAGAVLCATAGADEGGQIQLDPKLWQYQKVTEPLSGNLNSVGSDTMNNLMTLWAEGFARYYPGVRIQVEGKGSSTAPPALIEGTSQFGPMSRAMKDKEVDAFEKKFGYKPTQMRTSMDALAVFVHRDNPVKSLSLTQVDSIFSSTRKRGGNDAATWGDLGLTGDWASKPINMYGRNSASGTYGFFKKLVLKKGDYRDTVKEQPGSAAVVQGVTEDRYAIGYSGIGYKTSGVRAAPLSASEGEEAFEANYQNVVDGTYPLGRYLYLYINKAPNKPLSPLVREFLRFVFSKEGQEVVVKDGYLPLDEKGCARERAKLD
jgi:phosphate transport system substrate-binding protein